MKSVHYFREGETKLRDGYLAQWVLDGKGDAFAIIEEETGNRFVRVPIRDVLQLDKRWSEDK